MTARKGKPQRVGETLAKFLGTSGLAARVEQAGIIPEWPELVGKQISAVTEPHHIARDGTLFVAVRTNAWMNELSLMEPQLLAALNAKPGRTKLVRIHWQLMR
jgi:predicted nucleic acid-binding Zn ribbon protein